MHSLPVPRPDDADAAARDVAEADVEPAELVPDDEEHPEGLLWVLGVGEEVGREAEGQSDFGGLVEVRFEDVPGQE